MGAGNPLQAVLLAVMVVGQQLGALHLIQVLPTP